jgi:hypothetical protein
MARPQHPLDLLPHRLRSQVDAAVGTLSQQVRLGVVAPAVFPAEQFDLYPDGRLRVIRPQGGALSHSGFPTQTAA